MRYVAAFLCLLFGTDPSLATSAYPLSPIRLIVPFPAGSTTDAVARIVGQEVSKTIGQPIIVENKAGADGAIAGAEVARAKPDGYTIFLGTNGPMSVVPALRKKPPYDPVKDFTAITELGRYSLFLVVHPSIPATNVEQLIAYARDFPGALSYATGNAAGVVSMALFTTLTKTKMVHVPYRGEPAALSDLLAGRVQLMIATAATTIPQITAGTLHALAHTSSAERSSFLPAVPSIAESGLSPLLAVTGWAAVFGPAGMPNETIEKLNDNIVRAISKPEVRRAIESQGFMLRTGSQQELLQLVEQQLQSYKSIVSDAQIELMD